jgi:hypothetical protein
VFITKVLRIFIYVVSAVMIFSGFISYLATRGLVRGTEFSMLISLVNSAGLLCILVGLLAIYYMISESRSKKSDDVDTKS